MAPDPEPKPGSEGHCPIILQAVSPNSCRRQAVLPGVTPGSSSYDRRPVPSAPLLTWTGFHNLTSPGWQYRLLAAGPVLRVTLSLPTLSSLRFLARKIGIIVT